MRDEPCLLKNSGRDSKMAERFPVQYTERALRNGLSIREYLIEEFSEKQVEKFYKLLEDFEKSVSRLPEL